MTILARILLVLILLIVPTERLSSQPAPMEHSGAAALGVRLRQLGQVKRVLMVGAHPDDESTQIISRLALGDGADVGYLSLTRGEGGQNGIGSELHESLGVLRSRELLAARSLDGAHQFFTRAYDFGFSKTADEAFGHWPRDSLLADMVAVVREFRPDVIISVFTGTPADGHGQHQVAGLLARELMAAAGDTIRFPVRVGGHLPHRPVALFSGVWRTEGDPALTLGTGVYDALLGRSYHQVAMRSRSRHRSQDMGRAEPPGPQRTPLMYRLAPSDDSRGASVFAGVDTLLSARATTLAMRGPSAERGALAETARLLRRYEAAVTQARVRFNPLVSHAIVPTLVQAGAALDGAWDRLAGSSAGTASSLRALLAFERARLADAIARAAGVTIDVVADAPQVVPGDTLGIEIRVWNGGSSDVLVDSIWPRLPTGWTVEARSDRAAGVLAVGELRVARFRVRLPQDARVTEPYFLRAPRDGDLYQAASGSAAVGLPFEDGPVAGHAAVRVGGRSLPVRAEAAYVDVDPMSGERRVPLRVVPAYSVKLAPAVVAVSVADVDRPRGVELRVEVRNVGAVPGGVLKLHLPDGWRAQPAQVHIASLAAAETRSYAFELFPPASAVGGRVVVSASLVDAAGRGYTRGYTEIRYPHISPDLVYAPARATLAVVDARIPRGLRVGFVAGAGEIGAVALAQLGAEVEPLDAAALASADLGRFDAILTGIRAYEVRPELRRANARLLEYVRAGGVLVVQYSKYEVAEPGIAPYPLRIARPHGRVTNESAPVTFLSPADPVLTWPNRLTPADFDGWAQERGIYFPSEWDPRYRAPLSMADPGEPAQHGALLIASVGRGSYVYTGLSLFRQLDAGVPGAYRLLANLVSIGRNRP